ncbi:MAG: glucans biosynthesis glucosyltransferase MdoH [Alphaproteobacteria bacterium]|nr:glucans biosynthesis glucosyltransferase MdoH [Alphaproteobacteria bacterium]
MARAARWCMFAVAVWPRRIIAFGLALLAVAALGALLAGALAPGGWTPAKLLLLAGFAGTAPWLGLGIANGLIGFAILLLARDPVRAAFPAPLRDDGLPLPLALLVAIRSEAMGAVLPPLRALLDGLDAAGAGGRVGLFLLSDTPAPATAEAAAVEAFRAADPVPARIRYRRRASNAGYKAGNVMDALDHLARDFALAVVLDADSRMTAAAVLRLAGILEGAPRLGLVQQLAVGSPAAAAFPRLFQFGMRAGMRVWATGQGWWQGDEGPFWGHNAAFRIAPFRDHARLAPLPDGTPILSHDQVEAAQMRAAGWGVAVLPEEDGSFEENPPALPEFLRRDTRWLAGNFQYRHLLLRPGFRPMGRWQLLQAILLFAGAPFQAGMVALLAGLVATRALVPVGPAHAAALAFAWVFGAYASKLLGYVQVMMSAPLRARYGGGRRFLLGAATEFGFSLLLDPIVQVSRTLAMLRGGRGHWAAQNRVGRRVGWAEATHRLWPHTLLGVALFTALAAGSWRAALWLLPFAGGLPAAIPFAVLTAAPGFSAWLRRRRIAATPEELQAAPIDSYFSSRHAAGSAAAASYQAATSGKSRTAAQ